MCLAGDSWHVRDKTRASETGLGRSLCFAEAGSRTLLELLKALECDFELVLVGQSGLIVLEDDAEEGNDRHVEGWAHWSRLWLWWWGCSGVIRKR